MLLRLEMRRALPEYARTTLLLALLAGCNELPPIEHETEDLRIGTDFDGPLCAGTLADFQQQVDVVEEVLGLRVTEKLELFLFFDKHELFLFLDDGDWCSDPESIGGCYNRQKQQAYSTFTSARHEIVHAVVHAAVQRDPGDSLFEEGLATDLANRGLGFRSTLPSANLGLWPLEVSSSTAAHFMRFIRTRYTEEQLADILIESSQHKSPEHAKQAFTRATGDDFDEIEQLYLDTAPEFWAPRDPVAPPLAPASQDGWQITFDLDCNAIDTQGFHDHMWQRVRINVTTPGTYVFVVTPPATATINRHLTEDVPAGQPFPDDPPWPIGFDWFQAPEVIPSDWPTEMQLDVGFYDIEVQVPGVSPTTAVVRLFPKLGSISEVP